MIYAHVSTNQNNLHWLANTFEVDRGSDIFRRKSIKGGISFMMRNGNEHVFLLKEYYDIWKEGKIHKLEIVYDKYSNIYEKYALKKINSKLRLIRKDMKDRFYLYCIKHDRNIYITN